MATYKLSSQQIVTINEAIGFLDAFGTQHSPETVFSEYTFYRRQTTSARQLETLEGLITTLRDIQQQLNNTHPKATLPEQAQQAKLLESQMGYILLGLRLKAQSHRARAAAKRVGNFLIGG